MATTSQVHTKIGNKYHGWCASKGTNFDWYYHNKS